MAPTLLNLPAEIRIQILEHLVLSHKPLSRTTRLVAVPRGGRCDARSNDIKYWRFQNGGQLDLHPQVLRVCRQLYIEANPILYGNTVRISLALFHSSSMIDVLGHRNFGDLLEPESDSGLAQIGRFSNFEFRIFVDFTSRWAYEGNSTVTSICSDLADMAPAILNKVSIVAYDGSCGKRYSDELNNDLWTRTLSGLKLLRCKSLSMEGDMPATFRSSVKDWIVTRKSVDDQSSVGLGERNGPVAATLSERRLDDLGKCDQLSCLWGSRTKALAVKV